jgi:alpha-aminoadipic semialdehyde synthase
MWTQAGAEAHDTLEPAHITVGIKETPLGELLTSPVAHPLKGGALAPRTHFMFSHTIKGQAYNMPLLSRFLPGCPGAPAPAGGAAPLPRLIDYELLCGPDGKRTVAFGWFAGGVFRGVERHHQRLKRYSFQWPGQ